MGIESRLSDSIPERGCGSRRAVSPALPKVGLDLSALDPTYREHSIRGIGRYVSELHRYFEANPSDNFTLTAFDHRQAATFGLIDRLIDSTPIARRTLRQQILYPLKLSRRDEKVLHFPAHMDAPSWGGKPYIITVLDLISFVLKDMYKAEKPGLRFHFARFLEVQAIKNAKLILAISEQTKRDVVRVLGVPEERIVVTPLGVDVKFFKAEAPVDRIDLMKRYNINVGRPIVLYVGGIDPRKNWSIMLEVIAGLKGQAMEHDSVAPQLVMAGGFLKDLQYPKLQRAIVEAGLSADVVCPGYVPDQDLLALYAVADVFFFPSLYEGFGLPPLEAMAAGTPVVSANTSSLPEVTGEACLGVDPTNAKMCIQAITQILENPHLAAELRVKGKARAKLFSWSRTGELTTQAYERAISS